METSIKCVKYTLFLFNLLFTVGPSSLSFSVRCNV